MYQFLIALDQLLNTLIPIGRDGFGKADEMLSARAWRLRAKSDLYIWIDNLFFWDDFHCEECYVIELERKQLPEEYWIKPESTKVCIKDNKLYYKTVTMTEVSDLDDPYITHYKSKQERTKDETETDVN